MINIPCSINVTLGTGPDGDVPDQNLLMFELREKIYDKYPAISSHNYKNSSPICAEGMEYLHLSYIYHKLKPSVGKYSIHGGYGIIAGKSCINTWCDYKSSFLLGGILYGRLGHLMFCISTISNHGERYTEGVQHLHGNLRLTPQPLESCESKAGGQGGIWGGGNLWCPSLKFIAQDWPLQMGLM